METTQSVTKTEIELPSDRSFGFLFCAVFLIVALWPLFSAGQLRTWAIIVAAFFALAALVAPSALTPLNRLWMQFGALLHKIVSPVALGILFFGVITPYGLVMRAFKRDLLGLQFQDSESYWVDRSPPGPTPQSMDRQF